MEEVESMWMEMVVFRIDMMNNWTDRHGGDRCEDNGDKSQTHEATDEGLLRCDGPDTRTK